MISAWVEDAWHGVAAVILGSTFLTALGLGILPGWVLRLAILAFPKKDPRRSELVSELYAVPYAERPIWVAQCFEIAVSEGLSRRWQEWARGRAVTVRPSSMVSSRAASGVFALSGLISIAAITPPYFHWAEQRAMNAFFGAKDPTGDTWKWSSLIRHENLEWTLLSSGSGVIAIGTGLVALYAHSFKHRKTSSAHLRSLRSLPLLLPLMLGMSCCFLSQLSSTTLAGVFRSLAPQVMAAALAGGIILCVPLTRDSRVKRSRMTAMRVVIFVVGLVLPTLVVGFVNSSGVGLGVRSRRWGRRGRGRRPGRGRPRSCRRVSLWGRSILGSPRGWRGRPRSASCGLSRDTAVGTASGWCRRAGRRRRR
jgi:hypothetical protein